MLVTFYILYFLDLYQNSIKQKFISILFQTRVATFKGFLGDRNIYVTTSITMLSEMPIEFDYTRF